jgi:hypothetical protein
VVKYQKYRAQQGTCPALPRLPHLSSPRRKVSDQAVLHIQPPPRDVRHRCWEHLHDLPGHSSLTTPALIPLPRCSTLPSPTRSWFTSPGSGNKTAPTVLSFPRLGSRTTSPLRSPSSVPSLSPPPVLLLTLPSLSVELLFDPFHVLFYGVLLLSMSATFAKIWVEVSGLTSKAIAKDLREQDIVRLPSPCLPSLLSGHQGTQRHRAGARVESLRPHRS